MNKNPFAQSWIRVAGIPLFLLGLPKAGAASLYWDGASTGPDADGGSGTWSAAPATTNWDTSAGGGSDVPWTNGSDAIFGGKGGSVTVSGTVGVNSMQFLAPGYGLSGGNVALTGTPVIDVGGNDVLLGSVISGSTPIAKSGVGTLVLSGMNTFTEAFTITAGTVKADNFNALGTSQGGTTVSQGATLELNGQNLGDERVTISGAGVDGKGAIVSNGATGSGKVRSATLAGHATLGGTKRWDLGGLDSLAMAGHTLTKSGSCDLHLTSRVSSPGNIDITEGSLLVGPVLNPLPGTAANVITIRNGAMFGQASNDRYSHPWTAIFETNTIWRISTNSSRWDGPVMIAGSTTLDLVGSAGMSHSGVIDGPGSITKTGTGTWTLNSLSSHSGGTSVNAGKLILNAANTSTGVGTLRGPVSVNGGGTLDLALAGAMGSSTGTRISPLNINGGLVDNTSTGVNEFDVVNLVGGALRSSTGVNSPVATSYFSIAGDSMIHALAADIPSVISGRLDLGQGMTGMSANFHVEAGDAAEDLRIDAAITEATAGRGISKTGDGLMALNGPCFFTGGTTVLNGTLMLVAGGILPDSPVTVEPGGRFGSSAAGKTLAPLVANAGSTLVLPTIAGRTTTVAGELVLADGEIQISPLLGAGTEPGTYDLVTADGITAAGTPVLNIGGTFGSSRAFGSVAVSGNKLQLTLSGTGGTLVWNNASAGGSATGIWDTALANFSHEGVNDFFQAFDSVTFNDSVAPGSDKIIALGNTLAPALMTVANSSGAYTFGSEGGLAGAGSLVKTGSSALTIGATSSYTMSGGITAGGGSLDFSGKPVSIDHLRITGGGGFHNATADFNSASFESGSSTATLVGPGSWTKTTGGTVVLSANNLLSGAGIVAEGTLSVGNPAAPNAIGALGTGLVDIAANASVVISRSDAPVITTAFNGAGELHLKGVNSGSNTSSDFRFSSDNSGFSGSMIFTNARLRIVTGKELGSGQAVFTGRASIFAQDMVVPNTLYFSPTGVWGYPTSDSNLTLVRATLTGPIYLAGSTTTILVSSSPTFGFAKIPIDNVVSGPIGENGGSGSITFQSRFRDDMLTLSGASSYTGTTTISAADVNLTGSLGATAVIVESGSKFGGTGSIGEGGSLTFNHGATLKLKMSGGSLTIHGDVNLGPRLEVAVDLTGTPFSTGPFPVLNYTGTLTGDTAALVMDDPYRNPVFGFAPGQVTLDIGSKALIWKGESGNQWEVDGPKLWNTTGSGETDSFYKGDSVLFDDTGSNHVSSFYVMEPSTVLFNNNTKDYSMSANIGGPCTLTKRGVGGLRLSSTNSHTGGTIIEAGRLEAQYTAMGTGPVMVAAGATLAGDAQITGPVTIAGTLDPGIASQNFPGTMSTGPTILTGNYLCELGAHSSDWLAVTGDLDLTGSTLTLNMTSYDTYRPFFTIATYTGTLTGSFSSVTGTPPGYQLAYDTLGKKIIVTPTFQVWVKGFHALADISPGGDPDGDGIPNLIEFATGGHPGLSDASIPQLHELNANNLLFRYKRSDSSLYSTSQVVQWSSDFVVWNDIPVTISSSQNIHVSPNSVYPDDITVTIPRTPGRMLVRLKIIQP